MDDLERELLNNTDMSTSINKIRNNETDFINRELKYTEREPFSDSKIKECDAPSCKKKFSVNSFVQDLETNLDNFDNIKHFDGPLPSNINFKKELEPKKIKKIENLENTDFDSEEEKEEKQEKKSWKEIIYNLLIKIKEPIILILLFIILNHPDLIRAITKIPYFNKIPTNYPSLILRGAILALIINLLR